MNYKHWISILVVLTFGSVIFISYQKGAWPFATNSATSHQNKMPEGSQIKIGPISNNGLVMTPDSSAGSADDLNNSMIIECKLETITSNNSLRKHKNMLIDLYYSPKSLYYRNKKTDKCYQVILRPLVEESDFEITQIDLRNNRTRLLIEITGQQHKKIAGWYGYHVHIDLDDNSIIYMIYGLKWDTSPKWR